MTNLARIRALSRFLLVLLSLCLVGCTALYGSPPEGQCSTDADCESEPALRGRVCDQVEHVCVLDASTVQVSDAPPGCVSTDQCTRVNGGPSVCRQPGTPCVNLDAEDCEVSGEWQDPRAFFIGTVAPHTYRQLSANMSIAYPAMDRLVQAFDLGLDEWNAQLPSGLMFSNRPLAAVHCNSNADTAQIERVMAHLVSAVKAKAVVVAGDIELAELSVPAAESDTALLCMDCVKKADETDVDADLWSITPALSDQVPLMVWRTNALETQIRSERDLTESDDVRVALLYQDYPGVNELAADVRNTLVLNGQPVADGSASFIEIKTPDPRFEPVDLQGFANQLIDFAPDIIIAPHGPDFTNYYLTMIESGWDASVPRPHYVLTSLNQELGQLGPVVPAHDGDLFRRISGTGLLPDQGLRDNRAAFTASYRAQYNQNRPENAYPGYEAFYTTAFSLVLANAQNSLDSGQVIARGFEQLSSGTRINLGPETINTALAGLIYDGEIDMVGVGSYLDLSGMQQVSGDIGMWCLSLDDDGYLKIVDDVGVRYDRKTGSTTGDYVCP